jgi:hypothetical protein
MEKHTYCMLFLLYTKSYCVLHKKLLCFTQNSVTMILQGGFYERTNEKRRYRIMYIKDYRP